MRKDVKERIQLMKKDPIKPNYAEIARRLDCDYRTVKKYYEKDDKDQKRERKTLPSKLDPYKTIVTDKYLNHGSSAKSIYYFIKNKGFEGSYDLVKRYCKDFKDEQKKKATIRFETTPGMQAQVDWKEKLTMVSSSGEIVEINIFLMVLGFSRTKYIELTLDKTQNTLFECMINGFKYFGGVPKEIIFDNMKTVVDRSRSNYNEAVINSSFYQFSRDIGFKVFTCRAFRPQTKGKVEALAKLMARLKPYNNEFKSIKELHDIVNRLRDELNNKEYSLATGKIPKTLLKTEKEYLLKLPSQTLMQEYLNKPISRIVTKESMVSYKYNKYSLPTKYIGKTVNLEVDTNKLIIKYENIIVATHEIAEKKFNYREVDYKEILSSDAFKYKHDDEIDTFAKQALAIYDKF